MSFRDRFKKKKALLSRQHSTQANDKGQQTQYPSVIRKDLLPEGIEIWRVSSEDHIIDILPFEAGPDFPIDISTGKKLIEEGDPVYVLDLMIHKNIGPMQRPFVCPEKNYGLPCPICEFMKANRLEKEDWKKINAKRTTFYLVWVHDTNETEKKGIHLWEASSFVMEEKLAEISKLRKGGGVVGFSDPDDGKSIMFTKKGKGGKNVEWLGHRFVDREMSIPEKLLDMTFPIDTVIDTHPSYESIEAAFMGQKGKLSLEGDVEKSGSAFSGSGHSSSDDTPDWMKTDDPEEKKEKPKPSGKRKLVLKKKSNDAMPF